MEDFIRKRHDENVLRNLALKWIQDKLHLNQTMEDLSLPIPDFHLINQLNQDHMGETNENTRQEKIIMSEMMLAQLNDGQRADWRCHLPLSVQAVTSDYRDHQIQF
jgi:hypothetical protein